MSKKQRMKRSREERPLSSCVLQEELFELVCTQIAYDDLQTLYRITLLYREAYMLVLGQIREIVKEINERMPTELKFLAFGSTKISKLCSVMNNNGYSDSSYGRNGNKFLGITIVESREKCLALLSFLLLMDLFLQYLYRPGDGITRIVQKPTEESTMDECYLPFPLFSNQWLPLYKHPLIMFCDPINRLSLRKPLPDDFYEDAVMESDGYYNLLRKIKIKGLKCREFIGEEKHGPISIKLYEYHHWSSFIDHMFMFIIGYSQ